MIALIIYNDLKYIKNYLELYALKVLI